MKMGLGNICIGDIYSIFTYPSVITALGDTLEVGKDLDLNQYQRQSLPENMKIGRNIYLRDSRITSLPKVITFGKNIDASGCSNLKELPGWAFSLGTRSEGKIRTMILSGTGLTDETKDKLRQRYPVKISL